MSESSSSSNPVEKYSFHLCDGGVFTASLPSSPQLAASGPKVKLDIGTEDFCLILPYLRSGQVPARTRVADWPKFVRACAAVGACALPDQVSDEAETVYRGALAPAALLAREVEKRVRAIYFARERDGCDDPPADGALADQLAALSLLDEKSPKLKLCATVAAVAAGAAARELPANFNRPLSDAEFTRSYPYMVQTRLGDTRLEYVAERAEAIASVHAALPGFPWAGAAPLVLAGGGALKHLATPDSAVKFCDSDYDFFPLTRDPAAAREAVARVHAWVSAQTGGVFMAWRTAHAVTFATARAIYQVPCRLLFSEEQLLCGFDLDCCCISFNGERFLTTARGLAALRSNVIMADPERQSTTYAERLQKYMRRGFLIAYPGLSARTYRRIVQPEPRALARLLSNEPARSVVERILRGGRIRPAVAEPLHDYAPAFAQLPHGVEKYPARFQEYIRGIAASMRAASCQFTHVFTRDLAALLDTPPGKTAAQLLDLAAAADPDSAYTAPNSPQSSVKFLARLGHGQLSGSINPLSMRHWYPDEISSAFDE